MSTVKDNVKKFNDVATLSALRGELLGELKPLFRVTVDGQFELALDVVDEYLAKGKIDPESVEGLQIREAYLQDAENIVRSAASS